MKNITTILILAFLLRLAFSSFGTYWPDMNTWIGWSNRLLEVGLGTFYQSWCDYLPGYLYILFLLGKIKIFFQFLNFAVPHQILFKTPSILTDIGTGYLIFKLAEKLKNKKTALLASIFYLFNPAILVNSTLWGQADSFFSFFLILGFWFVAQKSWLPSGLFLAYASLTKPQGIIILPFVFLFMLKSLNYKKAFCFLFSFLTVYILAFLPFTDKQNIFLFIKQRLEITLNQYQYTSLNAFNFWAFIGKSWQDDKFYKWIGFIIFSLLNLSFLFFLFKKWSKNQKGNLVSLLKIFSLIFFASFLFLTRAHERHLFPMLPFLAILTAFYPSLWLIYSLSSLIYILNLRFAFVWLTQNFRSIFSSLVIQFFSGLQLVNFTFLFFASWIVKKKFTIFDQRPCLAGRQAFVSYGKFLKQAASKKIKVKKVKVKHCWLYLILILSFAFFSRLYRLNYPDKHYFDEVYHAFTAGEMVKGNKAVWEWWNKPPEGFAYEWTHPPLAKLLMASGILALGNKAFAWRLPAVIFGVGAILLTFLLAKQLFKNEKIALLSALLISFDGLPFVMSRIGMSDIYFLFFLLATIYFALTYKFVISGLFLGLSLATKWTGIYLYPVLIFLLGFDLQDMRFKIRLCKFDKEQLRFGFLKVKPFKVVKWLTVFILIPIVVYLLSYTLFFTSGHTWSQFVELQKQMWWYHTGLKATHAYQSAASTWPFMTRSVWLYVDYQKDKIANIYALGNPIVWWSWLPAVLFSFLKGIKERYPGLLFVIFCYFIFWLPWLASPRIMFLYHYLPAIPFLCILLAWSLVEASKKNRELKLLFTVYCLLITFCFFFFYPIYAGVLIPKKLLNFYFWLSSWR